LKALELIGRHLGMFTDKVEHSGGVALNNPFEELTKEQLLKLAGEDDG
jgi:phage terminase small subunit